MTTSAGIIIIDPLYDYNVKDEIIDGLKKLGLDPADITHVLVSHGHGDHYDGARALQDAYGARVLLSAADWDLMLGATRGQPKPTRDMVVTDNQQFRVGETTLRFILTPGHTAGTISTVIPVRDGAASHVAVLWGGTAMRPTEDFYNSYIASAKRFGSIATEAAADVIISNHSRFDGADDKIAALKQRQPGDPHPFVIGTDAAPRYMKVVQECAAAGLARLRDPVR